MAYDGAPLALQDPDFVANPLNPKFGDSAVPLNCFFIDIQNVEEKIWVVAACHGRGWEKRGAANPQLPQASTHKTLSA